MTPQGFESNFRSMRDIHTSIVSQHLAARDNNKYCSHTHRKSPSPMRAYPGTRVVLWPNYEEKNPSLLLYLHKIDILTHPSPLCPLCRTHEHIYYITSPQLPTDTHYGVDLGCVEGSLWRSSPARCLTGETIGEIPSNYENGPHPPKTGVRSG